MIQSSDAEQPSGKMHTRYLVAACFYVTICGCTLAKLQHESAARETRIDEKEQDLKQLEDRRAALSREQKNLLSDLDQRQVTLNELSVALDRMRTENARMKVDNERQQKEKENLELQIQKFQGEIKGLNNDRRLSAKEKQERIESLKKEIKKYLELMLVL